MLLIIMITFMLSLAAIYQGFQDYVDPNKQTEGVYFLSIGVSTLAISTYLLFQTKKRVLRMGPEIQPLNTTLLCPKCGFKNVRDFQRGDYIFKQVEEPCPKCNEKALSISSIFREVKEKTKGYGFS